jgi:putative ABC transport system permease protein
MTIRRDSDPANDDEAGARTGRDVGGEVDDARTHDRAIFRRSVDREVDDELAFHLAMRARDLAAGGSADAERSAAAEFGDIARVKHELKRIGNRRDRNRHRIRFFGELAQDLRFAFRLLRRRPAFAALAVVTTALGIGAATAVFSIVDGVLLRPLPFADPGRLVTVWLAQPSLASDPVLSRLARSTVLGSEEFTAVRDHTTAFQNLALWAPGSAILAGTNAVEQVNTVNASASLLPVLGEQPALGRNFLPGENVVNGPNVALVGWETWQSRFGGEPQVLGRPVVLDGDTYTIVGVLPRGLRLNRAADPPAFWLPALRSKYDQPQYHNRSFRVVGRLRPNVSAEQAQIQVARAVRTITGDSALSARVEDWNRDQTHDSRGPLLIVLAASGLLLLIGCVNVAILTLGESASRAREFAARVALGAGATRVVRQLLAESMMIAAAGAVAGSGLAWAFTHALVALAPPRVPGIGEAGVNLRVLLFAIACTACVAIIAGLAPGLTVLRAGESLLLRAGAGQSARHARGTQQWLVATEIALSLVLLVGAALLSRSLRALTAVDPGFRPANLFVVRVAGSAELNANDARLLAYFQDGVRRLAAIPGVRDVSAGGGVPFSGGSSSSPVAVAGRVYDKDHPAPHTEQRSELPG